jgi:dihydroneopterin aldolase
MGDVIRITGLRVRGYHGVFDFERQDGQDFLIDAALEVDATVASDTDSLDHTVNYADVVNTIAAIVEGDPVDLIETLATRIGEAVLSRFAVSAVTITVHKPHAPLDYPVSDVSFTTRLIKQGGARV